MKPMPDEPKAKLIAIKAKLIALTTKYDELESVRELRVPIAEEPSRQAQVDLIQDDVDIIVSELVALVEGLWL